MEFVAVRRVFKRQESVAYAESTGGVMINQKSKTSKKKSGIKKAFVVSALILILLIAAVLVCVLTRLDAIVKAAIEKYGSEAAGTAVRVESVKIRIREGSGAVKGLTLANPEGFKDSHAFSLGEIGIGIDIRSLTQDVKIIDDIRVIAPEIFVEMNSSRVTNLNVIRKNLEKSAPGEKAASPRKSSKAGKDESGSETRMIIRRILFSDGLIRARIAPLNGRTFQLKLPSIEMRNLGGKNGATPDELTRQIIGELCRRAAAEVEKKTGEFMADKAKDAVRSQIEGGVGRLLR